MYDPEAIDKEMRRFSSDCFPSCPLAIRRAFLEAGYRLEKGNATPQVCPHNVTFYWECPEGFSGGRIYGLYAQFPPKVVRWEIR